MGAGKLGSSSHAVDHRGRSNQTITVRSDIGDMQPGAAPGDSKLNGEYAPSETRQKLIFEPTSQDACLRPIALVLKAQNTDLDFLVDM